MPVSELEKKAERKMSRNSRPNSNPKGRSLLKVIGSSLAYQPRFRYSVWQCQEDIGMKAWPSSTAEQYLQHELAAEVGNQQYQAAAQRPAYGTHAAPAQNMVAEQQDGEDYPGRQ